MDKTKNKECCYIRKFLNQNKNIVLPVNDSKSKHVYHLLLLK